MRGLNLTPVKLYVADQASQLPGFRFSLGGLSRNEAIVGPSKTANVLFIRKGKSTRGGDPHNEANIDYPLCPMFSVSCRNSLQVS